LKGKKQTIYYQQNSYATEILQQIDRSDRLNIYWKLKKYSIAFSEGLPAHKHTSDIDYSYYNPEYCAYILNAETDTLKQAIEQTRYAVATDPNKQVLNCLALVPNKEDNTRLEGAIATDGHRMAIYGDRDKLETDRDLYILIPLPVVEILTKLFKVYPHGTYQFQQSDRITKIETSTDSRLLLILSFTTIDGYPNCLNSKRSTNGL
jgi:hypothetical protein